MTQRASRKPLLCLVTPALADANNGNWQTAKRWARMVSDDYRVDLVARWDGSPCDALLALHARRSAASIHAFAKAHPGAPLLVALTGTDLYQDLAVDADARRSLKVATRLIVLQDQAPLALPPALREKTDVCYQSTPARERLRKTQRTLRAVVVGHLRSVKDPLTVVRAAERLAHRRDIEIEHIGAALDDALALAVGGAAARLPSYRWVGALPHARALSRIRHAHVLVHPSVLEGGAHVVMEAVQCGTPVLASRMPGNVGMLGKGYQGYFDVGDDAALAALLERARDDPAWLARLTRQGDRRAARFDPDREQRTLLRILRRAFKPSSPRSR